MNISWFSNAAQRFIGFYDEHERIAAPLVFLGGVTYDTLTVTRIDRLFENLFIFAYLCLLGVSIVIYGRFKRGALDWDLVKQYEDYFHILIQFLMGGLLSVYTIFYFRSTPLSSSAIFVVLLGILLIANEFLTNRLLNLNLLLVLHFFAWLSFCVFFVPVMIGQMGDTIFYASCTLSFIPTVTLLYFLYRPNWFRNAFRILKHAASILLLCLAIVVLYAQHLIPPIPMSMEEGGVYYNVTKTNSTYHLTYQKPPYYKFWETSAEPFYWAQGRRVYCFVSIFAPTDFEATVHHQWQQYDPEQSVWRTTDNIAYDIHGGRRGGYRGYTYKQNVEPGHWRVNVLTMDNRVLGRVHFEIVEKPEGLNLRLITKDA